MPSSSPAKLTLNDVARGCGVSRATVSLVLRGSPLVHPDTRAKVEAEIRRIVLQDARSVLTGTDQGAQHQQCIQFMAGYLQNLMEQGVIVRASPVALARLLNGCLVEAAFWIAEEGAPPQRLGEALQALDLMLEGWKAG